MNETELKILFPSESLDALRFFMDKKQLTVENELKVFLDKTYEKVVPAQVREYVERGSVESQQMEAADQAPQRERQPRQSRRQREQVSGEMSSTSEVETEAPIPEDEESQVLTMSM